MQQQGKIVNQTRVNNWSLTEKKYNFWLISSNEQLSVSENLLYKAQACDT